MNRDQNPRRNVFVSYSEKDRKIVEKILKDVLPEKEFYIYRGENTDSIKYLLTESIIDAICRSEIYMVFISAHSKNSKWVNTELEVIEQENQKGRTTPIIFPVYLDEFTNFFWFD